MVCISGSFLAFQSLCQPLALQQCMPFRPQIGYGWLFMCYHLAGAWCARVSGQNCPLSTVRFHMVPISPHFQVSVKVDYL